MPNIHTLTHSLSGWRTCQRKSTVSPLIGCTWRRRDGRENYRSSRPPPSTNSTLHTEVRVEGEQLENVYGSVGGSLSYVYMCSKSDRPRPIRGYTSLHVHVIPRLHLRTTIICRLHRPGAHIHSKNTARGEWSEMGSLNMDNVSRYIKLGTVY